MGVVRAYMPLEPRRHGPTVREDVLLEGPLGGFLQALHQHRDGRFADPLDREPSRVRIRVTGRERPGEITGQVHQPFGGHGRAGVVGEHLLDRPDHVVADGPGLAAEEFHGLPPLAVVRLGLAHDLARRGLANCLVRVAGGLHQPFLENELDGNRGDRPDTAAAISA